MRASLLLLLSTVLLTSCIPAAPVANPTPAFTETPFATATPFPTDTPTFVPTISPTADPYYTWSNAYLRTRTYGGGQIEFLQVMDQNLYITRYLIRYPSDGLNIYGFADIPNDDQIHS